MPNTLELPIAPIAIEVNYTPEELAKLMKWHVATIRKRFVNEPGVVRLGHPANGRRRQYYTLRIPQSVVARVFGAMTVR
jgi:hypothetical protein